MKEVKPTWCLAWGLWWRMMLITLGIYVVIGIIALIATLIAGIALIPFIPGF